MTAVVVNHLRFRDPVSSETVQALQGAATAFVDAGMKAARVVQVDDHHLILLLDFESVDDANRLAREVGGPWMGKHIRPLLDGDTERHVGTVVVSA